MSDKSPLFVSSLELIAHATELFSQKNPKKYKFIVLHLANAVELVLKDCVIDQGMSIYEKPGITINIWECIRKLKDQGIIIPEIPVIELLIDDRNTIQHRFGYPSAESIYYYIEQVVNFFQRLLHHHYNVHLIDALKPHLSEEHLKLLGLVNDEFSFLDKLASISIESSILEAYKSIEREINRYIQPIAEKEALGRSRLAVIFLKQDLLNDLEKKGFFERNMREDYSILGEARNHAAHNPEDTSNIDWKKAFEIAKELLAGLLNATKAGYTFEPSEEIVNRIKTITRPPSFKTTLTRPSLATFTGSEEVSEGTSTSEKVPIETLNNQSTITPNSEDDGSW